MVLFQFILGEDVLTGTSRVAVLLLAVFLARAPAAEEPAHEARQASTILEFSVLGMTCDTCADTATGALAEIPGVLQATVDYDTTVGRVQTDGSVTRDNIREGLGTLGFEPLFAGETGIEPLSDDIRASLDIQTVSHGKAIRIKAHLAPGKLTVFDFYADWCGPCHLLTPKLERLVLRYENVALRKVDLVDWKSKAARQATREFKLPGLPFTQVYDDRGKLLGQVHGNAIDEIENLIQPHAQLRQ
ncbi:MAG: thioredoxin domain-containing protein [Acidobacteria bacterium]|nr:thioredoxin domain-containing protein [Acidobacteriota bacterium]